MDFYKSIIESSPAGYAYHKIILDENNSPCDYEFIEVNIAFENITGLKRSDILGKNISEVLPDIKKSEFNWIKFYGNIAINDGSEVYEQFSEPLNRWYRVNVYSPEKYYFISYFIDITKEKSQIDELNSFFELNLDLLCIADNEGNFIKTNKSWEKILGYSTAELNKRKFLEFVHPDDLLDTLEIMKSLDEQREVLNFVNRYLCKDKSYRWIEWRANPKGKLIYATARDITERVNASREILFQASLLEQVHNGIIVIDLNNTISYWNKFAEELYQWKSDEVIGKNIIDLLSPEEMKHAVYENFKVLNRDGHWEGDFNVKKKDGSLISVHITNTHSKDLEGNIIGFIGISRDITAHKQAEASLTQSEESKSVLLDNIQTQVWYLTNEYTYGAVNQAHATFYGVQIEDLAYKNLYDIFPADVVEVCRQSNTKVFATGKTVHIKEWLPHVSGEKRLVSISKTPKFRTDGSVEYVVCSANDITEQEIANEKIRSSEKHLNALVSNTPAVIYSYTIDIDGTPNLTYINNNVTNVLGFKPEDFIGNMALWDSCVHPEDMPKLQKNSTMKEYRFKDISGEYHWLLDQQNPNKKENGITEIVGAWWDITERKEMEEKLKESEFRFNMAIEGTNTGIWDWDMINDEVTFSIQWKKMLGYDDHEVENAFAGWKNLWHPDDATSIEKALNDYLAGKTEKYEIIHRCRHKNGDWRWIVTRGEILKDRENKPYRWIGTNVDITELKEIEAELLNAKEQAEAANTAKSQFLSNMSHEIRTPMNGFMGMIQLMQTTELTEEQQYFMRIAKSSADGLLNVINNILEYSRIEAGKIQFEKATFNLGKMINDTIDLFKISTENIGLLIEASIGNNVPDNLVGDSFRLNQIISNLIGNAVKFTRKGSIRIVVRDIKVQSNEEVKLEFVVKDTGIGIPLDKVDILFKSFSQVNSSTTRVYGGSGLGLSICKGLVEKMGGEIWVESIEGEGSSFYFTCVFEKAVEQIDSIEHAAVMQPQEQRDISILIVEDDSASRTVIEKFAERKGWKVTIAENSKQAFDIFKQKNFDIVLMDVQMPVMNGYETTGIFRGLESSKGIHTPIIAMTAFALKGDREKCIEAGMDDYLSKPVDVNEFYAAVEKWAKNISVKKNR